LLSEPRGSHRAQRRAARARPRSTQTPSLTFPRRKAVARSTEAGPPGPGTEMAEGRSVLPPFSVWNKDAVLLRGRACEVRLESRNRVVGTTDGVFCAGRGLVGLIGGGISLIR